MAWAPPVGHPALCSGSGVRLNLPLLPLLALRAVLLHLLHQILVNVHPRGELGAARRVALEREGAVLPALLALRDLGRNLLLRDHARAAVVDDGALLLGRFVVK